MHSPDIRFVRRPEAAIAYQVFGDGPDLLCMPGFVTNLEYQWQFALTARFFERLGSFARVAEIDRRGCGLSERVSPRDLPPMEVLIDDVCAVQDEAGFGQATVLAWADAAMQAMVFAAMHPERVGRLILFAASACGTAKPGYPWQWKEAEWESYLDEVARGWGTTEYFEELARDFLPSVARNPEHVRQLISFYRVGANASAAVTLERMYSRTDVRDVLPLIRVPTLLLHRVGDPVEDIGQSRYIASRIPDARLIELDGEDTGTPWAGDQSAALDAIEEFHTGRRAKLETDRILSTVMFTDIVDSTVMAAEIGDRRWSELLTESYTRSSNVIAGYGGKLVKTTGDGVVARFDGPARSVRCALEVCEAMRPLDLHVRGGCHTGEIQISGADIAGLAVHVGARIAAAARADEVLVSSTVRDLTAGSGIQFEDTGEHELKGVPDRWRLYRALTSS
jgi:class 3 adenylate cyclase